MKRRYVLLCLAGLTLACSVQAASLKVGGFNSARGGLESIENNTALRNLIVSQFSGTTFSTSTKLTASYLGTIDHLIIGVAVSCCDAVQPLSVAEQTALVDFVKAGGTALLFGDNDTYSANAKPANHGFMAPFGLSMTGTLDSTQSSTIVDSSSPVVTGPAGTAGGFDTAWPGWFSSASIVRAGAAKVAVLTANHKPSVAVLLPGALGAGSGAVVFFSDSNCLLTGGTGLVSSTNDDILILNSLALQP